MVDAKQRPLTRRYYCPHDRQMLNRQEIVRGFEIEKDRYVVLSDEELASAAPEKSRAIDLRKFVDAAEIDPTYFKRAYFLTPAEPEATRAYRLLAATMERSGRVGIATFVMRGKEYLIALTAENGVLRAETLRFPDEIRRPQDVGLDVGKVSVAGDAKRRYARAIAALAEDRIDAEELRDDYASRLNALVEHKLAHGIDVSRAPEPEKPDSAAEIIDLMQVLKDRLQPRVSDHDEDRSSRSGAGGPRRGRRTDQHERPAAEDLAHETKSQLYQRAQALQVPGRSRMDKEELLEALLKAGGAK